MSKCKKVLVLGVDGMDPRLAKRMMDEGKMPNLKKLMERGAMREDLQLFGALPTITPPMWTTLATGAYPETHGITCFYSQHPTDLDKIFYNVFSTNCKAEQVWNVTAEAGFKTLVWHWPGASWPPSSDSPNLHVLDGVTPASINMGLTMDTEKIIFASDKVKELAFKARVNGAEGAGCIIDDLDVDDDSMTIVGNTNDIQNIMLTYEDGEGSLETVTFDLVNSPITEPEGWAKDVPADAKEFSFITSKGLIKRNCLLLKEGGEYKNIEIYKNKRATEPIATLHYGQYAEDLLDECVDADGKKALCIRQATILEITPDGNQVRFWISNAVPAEDDTFSSPKSLIHQINENVGYVKVMAACGGAVPEYAEKLLCRSWENYTKWQAEAMNYLIDANGYDVVFSHVHNVDMMGHQCWRFAKPDQYYRDKGIDNPEFYQNIVEATFIDTDRYIGRFLYRLDEGWTIFVVSDHGFLCPQDPRPVPMADGLGVNAKVLYDLGYTALKKDENGNPLKEIDWEHTTAVAVRTCHIYINLKGRNSHGIVDPADKYALEDQLISDLYNYRDEYGRRVVSVAVRRKEARVFGLDSEECGDIIYFLVEGPNRGHCDSFSTTYGAFDTSLSPIFMAAGPGLKKNYITNRVIREVDVAPTIAALLGTRMPAQCEGAPAYQIFDEEYGF